MAETKIEWADYTFNPWIGCTKVSAGCAGCYAERDFDLRRGVAKWGPFGTRVVTSVANWKKPLAWNRKAFAEGRRLRVFCASLADVFEDWQGELGGDAGRSKSLDDVRRLLFSLIDATPMLDWLLLTKRPENVGPMWSDAGGLGVGNPRRGNVWIGTSVENQQAADKRIPELMKCRDLSPVLWISCEPLIGPVYLRGVEIDWLVAGGESGPAARPAHPVWVRSLRNQCHEVGAAFFFKQWGEWKPVREWDPRLDPKKQMAIDLDGRLLSPHVDVGVSVCNRRFQLVGKSNAGRCLDGREWNELPGAAF